MSIGAPSNGANHFDLPITPAKIISGWALIEYGGKSIALLGPGDFICQQFLQHPARYVPLGPLKLEREPSDVPAHNPTVAALGRQAARLSATAIARAADFLLEASEKAGCSEEHRSFSFPLSQAKSAGVLGMSAVHINRILMALQKMNVVSHKSGNFEILDGQRLVQIAAGIFD